MTWYYFYKDECLLILKRNKRLEVGVIYIKIRKTNSGQGAEISLN